MELHFDRTIDDALAFNLYHLAHSEAAKRAAMKQRLTVSLLATAATAGMVIYVAKSLDPLWLSVVVVIGVGFFILYPLLKRPANVDVLRKWLEAAKDDPVFGPQTLVAAADGLVTRNRLGESTANWSSVQRVCEGTEHLFVYTSATVAIVIPKRCFSSEEEKQAFLELVDANRGRS